MRRVDLHENHGDCLCERQNMPFEEEEEEEEDEEEEENDLDKL